MVHEAVSRKQSDVDALNDPGLYRFSPGLYLQVQNQHAKSWLYRFTINRQQRYMGLGAARDVTFAQARKRVDEIRVNYVSKRLDPIAERRQVQQRAEASKVRAVPFRGRAEQYITAHEGEWDNAKHRRQWRATLEQYAYPVIADLPTPDITTAHIVDILRPLWLEKHETARRLRGRIEAVLDYAADPNDAEWRNPAAMTGQLKKALPKRAKRSQPKHHASLPYEEMPAFMTGLSQRIAGEKTNVAAMALKFLILTAARPGEVTGAAWSEIDFSNAVWTVPAERMKARREHRVPLSDAALAILSDARKLHNGDTVFPSLPFDRQLSDAALRALLRRMGRTDLTAHGMRATFRTWAAEATNYPREAAEVALAHQVGDETERAYQRGNLFGKRRALMADWAAYCSALPEIPKVPA